MKLLSLSPLAPLAVIFNKLLEWFHQNRHQENHQVIYVSTSSINEHPLLNKRY